MKKIIILGASGFAKEVVWLIEEINKVQKKFEIIGIISNENSSIGSYQYLGNDECLIKYKDKDIGLVIAIGTPHIRKKIIESLNKESFIFPNIISNRALLGNNISIGIGNIIGANSIFTTDIEIGDFNIINLACTVGHDCSIGDFITINPGSNISGNVKIDDFSEVGTGTKIIQGIEISNHCIIGAGSVVVRDTEAHSTYVGVPARKRGKV